MKFTLSLEDSADPDQTTSWAYRGCLVLGKLSVLGCPTTIQILCIGTDRSQQTVQTKIRLLLKKQSDQGLSCLPVHQHLLDALMQCYVKRF